MSVFRKKQLEQAYQMFTQTPVKALQTPQEQVLEDFHLKQKDLRSQLLLQYQLHTASSHGHSQEKMGFGDVVRERESGEVLERMQLDQKLHEEHMLKIQKLEKERRLLRNPHSSLKNSILADLSNIQPHNYACPSNNETPNLRKKAGSQYPSYSDRDIPISISKPSANNNNAGEEEKQMNKEEYLQKWFEEEIKRRTKKRQFQSYQEADLEERRSTHKKQPTEVQERRKRRNKEDKENLDTFSSRTPTVYSFNSKKSDRKEEKKLSEVLFGNERIREARSKGKYLTENILLTNRTNTSQQSQYTQRSSKKKKTGKKSMSSKTSRKPSINSMSGSRRN